MIIIQQGDQYSIGFSVTDNDDIVTPSIVDDVRIQIGDNLKSYRDNELVFNEINNEWLYPLTQEETVAPHNATVPIQVGILKGVIIHYSEVIKVPVGKSIIKKEW